jgi:hypothetical protein
MKDRAVFFNYNIGTGETFGDPVYLKIMYNILHNIGPQDGNKLQALASKLKELYPTARIDVFSAKTSNNESNKNIVY